MARMPCPTMRVSGERRGGVGRECIYVFPAERGAALDTIDVPHGVVAGGHGAVVGLALDHVDTGRYGEQGPWAKGMQSLHAVKEVGPPVLAVEGLCSWSACVAAG